MDGRTDRQRSVSLSVRSFVRLLDGVWHLMTLSAICAGWGVLSVPSARACLRVQVLSPRWKINSLPYTTASGDDYCQVCYNASTCLIAAISELVIINQSSNRWRGRPSDRFHQKSELVREFTVQLERWTRSLTSTDLSAHRFYVLVLYFSVLVIPMCGRLSRPALCT